MENLVTLITQVGFPIVAFLIAVYGLKYAYDKSNEVSEKSLDKISNLTEAVNNNTLILTHLVEKMEKL